METFEARIEANDKGGAFVMVPDDVLAGRGRSRVPVRATFDGVGYRGSVVSMGSGRVLGLLKTIRAELGKEPGDTVTVTVEVDEEDREVVVPDDLRAALDGAGLAEAFAALSYSHRREHVRAIEEAKRADTRARRVAGAVGKLRDAAG